MSIIYLNLFKDAQPKTFFRPEDFNENMAAIESAVNNMSDEVSDMGISVSVLQNQLNKQVIMVGATPASGVTSGLCRIDMIGQIAVAWFSYTAADGMTGATAIVSPPEAMDSDARPDVVTYIPAVFGDALLSAGSLSPGFIIVRANGQIELLCNASGKNQVYASGTWACPGDSGGVLG